MYKHVQRRPIHVRLALARRRLERQRPVLEERLRRLCSRYTDLKTASLWAPIERTLLMEIQTLDTQLRVKDWPGVILRNLVFGMELRP